jgi:hypothetical protein
MKKNFFLSCLIPLLLFFTSSTLYAGAWADVRQNCWLWNLWGRYQANAETTTLWIRDCYSNRRNCGGIFPDNQAECDKAFAKARCWVTPDNAFIFADAAWNGIPHGAGKTPSQLYQDIFYGLKYTFTTGAFSTAECKFNHNFDQLSADSRTLKVSVADAKDSRNFIKLLKGSQMKATIRVDLWKAKDDVVNQRQDEDMTLEKVIHSEYIIVTQNGVEMSKGISDNKPSVKITDTEITVDLSSIALSIDIPSGIDIHSELVLRFTSDVAIDEEISMAPISQNIHTNHSELTINSNPTNGILAVTIVPKSLSELLTLKVYDTNGKLLQTIFSDKVEAKQLQLTADISSYANGIYIVSLIGNEGTASVKKVILLK